MRERGNGQKKVLAWSTPVHSLRVRTIMLLCIGTDRPGQTV